MALTKVTYSMIEGAPINVLDFGAVGNGVADDTAAIQAAVNSVTSSGCIFFPAGKYRITSPITSTNVTIAYRGEGPYVSELLCAGVNAGIVFLGDAGGTETTTQRFIANSFSMAKIYAPATGESGGTGIFLDWAYTGIIAHIDHAFIENVVVYGTTNSAYWSVGLEIRDGGGAYINNVKLSNEGSRGNTGSNTTAAFVVSRRQASNCNRFYINNSYFHRFERGMLFSQSNAAASGSIEGLYITNCEIVGCYRGVDAPAGATPLVDYVNGFEFTNSHVDFHYIAFDFYRIASSMITNGFYIHNDNGGTIANGGFFIGSSRVDGLTFTGNLCVKPSAFGSTTSDGVRLPADVVKVRVMENSFENLNYGVSFISTPLTIESKIAYADANQFVNCANEYETGTYLRQQSDYADVATGATISFPLPFGANPIVIISHEGTNTAINCLPTTVDPTEFFVTHNGVGSIRVNWTAIATN
jgi:hypothetical protein